MKLDLSKPMRAKIFPGDELVHYYQYKSVIAFFFKDENGGIFARYYSYNDVDNHIENYEPETELKYEIGDRFLLKSRNSEYILSQTGPDKLQMINLYYGNRFIEPIEHPCYNIPGSIITRCFNGKADWTKIGGDDDEA